MRAAVAAVIVLLLAGVASGATITQSYESAGIPNFQQTLTFDAFDTTLGQLDGVAISLGVRVSSGQVLVDNESSLSAQVSAALEAQALLSSSDVLLPALAASAEFAETISLAGDDGDGPGVDPTGSDGATLWLVGAEGAAWVQLLNTSGPAHAGQVASFTSNVAGERFTLDLQGLSTLTISGTGGVAGAYTPVGLESMVTVTYSYTPAVPEPASAVLMLISGAVLCGRRRSRQ